MLFAACVGRSMAPRLSVFPYPLSFDTFAHTCIRAESQPFCFQLLPHICRQNTRGGGRCSHRALRRGRSGGTCATLCHQPESTAELDCSPLAPRRSLPFKFPKINTYKSVSKQTTLTAFRMNTYTKTGEGGRLLPSLLRYLIASSLCFFLPNPTNFLSHAPFG